MLIVLKNLFIKLYFIWKLLYFSLSESAQVDDSGPKGIETVEHTASRTYHILPMYCCFQSWMFSLNSTDSSENCQKLLQTQFRYSDMVCCEFCMNFAVNGLFFFSVRNSNESQYDFVIRLCRNPYENPIVTKRCICVRTFSVQSTVCHLIQQTSAVSCLTCWFGMLAVICLQRSTFQMYNCCLLYGACVGIWPIYFLLMFNFFVQDHQAIGKITADQNCDFITQRLSVKFYA